MAEEALSEFVMNLLKWIESLHEKNLKYEAQVAGLKRDLDDAKDQLFAYQNTISIGSTNTNATGIELKVPMTTAADITSPETSSTTTSISATVAQSTASQPPPPPPPQQQQQQQAQLDHHQQQTHSSINCDLQHQQHLVQQQQTQHHLLHQPHQHQLQHQSTQHHNNQQHQVLYQPMAASQAFMHQPHQYLWTSYDPSTSGVIAGGNQNPYYEQYASGAQAFAQQQQ